MSDDSPTQPKSESQPTKERPWWRSKPFWVQFWINGVVAGLVVALLLNFKDVAFWILQIGSLGIRGLQTRLENAVYVRAAVGLHDASSAQLLQFVESAVVVSTASIAGRIFRTLHPRERKRSSKQISVDRMTLAAKIVGYSLVSFLLVSAGLLMILTSTLVQATNSAAHFQQMLTIVRPYMTADQEIQMRSQFAQMRTRSEYKEIDDELLRIISERNLRAPAFRVF